MAGFVQIIEFKTSRVNEIRDLVAKTPFQIGVGTPLLGTVTADLDRPGYYLNIASFASRHAAMENAARPEVAEFSAKMAALCDEPPRVYNLDVVEAWGGDDAASLIKDTVTGTAAAAAGIATAGAGMVRQRLQRRRGQPDPRPVEVRTEPVSDVRPVENRTEPVSDVRPADVISHPISTEPLSDDPQRPGL